MINIKTIADCRIRWRFIFRSFHFNPETLRPNGSHMSATCMSARRYANRLQGAAQSRSLDRPGRA
jgi:hypothetical protein